VLSRAIVVGLAGVGGFRSRVNRSRVAISQ
jgi:hypothetical protein